jgi:hypothetical protein
VLSAGPVPRQASRGRARGRGGPSGRRRLTLCLLLYVCVDLTNPFIPGAFAFDPDGCVDATTVHRDLREQGGGVDPVPAPARRQPPDAERREPVWRPVAVARPLADWLVDVRRAHARSTDAVPSPDD